MRLRVLERGNQRRKVGEIAADELDVGQLLRDQLGLGVGLALDQSERLVTLGVQELG